MLLLYSREGDLMESMYIILIVAFVVALVLGLLTIKLMRSYQSKKLLDGVNNLEIRKNNLESLPVMVELSKIEDIAKSEQLEERLNDFKERYQEIKETKLTKINNMIVDMDIVVEKRKVKEYHDKYADIEIELEEADYSLNKILEEINEIASYEEKYRDIVTKLKAKYRFLEKSFNEKESLFGDIKDIIKMQFENVEKRFSDFDTVMEEKLYNEVVLVVKSIDTMVDHLDVIIREIPDILLLLNDLIPGRIKDLQSEYDKMLEMDYPLGYLHFDDNLLDKDEAVKDVIVKVIDLNNQNTFLKDESGKDIEIRTNENGEYSIKDIPQGKYDIIFKYDANTYELGNNTKIKDYIIEATKEKVAITNNINLIADALVDVQLLELKEFNLKIDKYITKVIVQTQKETKTIEYQNKQLVRQEIPSKYISGATVLVEYTMNISNIGELAGYATEIVDYLPNDMKYHSELNTQWYEGEDGYLYNTSLATTEINPGETKTVKLVLLKTMTRDNGGTTQNTAEISDSMNIKAYADINLTDNQSRADIIISTATGSVLTYLIVVVNSILIVAAGAYLIKKKIIK